MKRFSFFLGIFGLIISCFPFILKAGSDPAIIPAEVDISVNDLFLKDAVSIETMLGKELKLIEGDYGYRYFYVTNKDYDEILTMVLNPGGPRNQFDEFEVKYLNKNFKRPVKQLAFISKFESGKKDQIRHE